MRLSAASTSLLLHLLAMVLLFLAGYSIPRRTARESGKTLIVPLRAPRLPASRGGGGGPTRLPPRRGRLPPPVMHRAFIPPMQPRIDQPRLAVQMASLETPEFTVPDENFGNPLGRLGSRTGGRGGVIGLGDGPPGPGTGSDRGDGPGGGAKQVPVRLSRGAVPIFRPEPEYSEQARKARFQGIVVLSVEIGTDGRTSKIRVVRGVGLGLDEKAVEAVSQWRFQPAMAGGKPVAVPALVEVAFHML